MPVVNVRHVAVLVYLLLAAPSLALGVLPQQEQDIQPSLQRAIELIEDGDFEAAASILETVTAGPVDQENVSSEPRDMVRAYLYLGIARLYLAGEDDARDAFRDAQRLDPTFQPQEVPRRAIDVWEEVRDLGAVVVVTAPEGAAVYVNGEMRGNSPLDLAMLPPGEYRVTATSDGYIEASRVVFIAPGSDETLRIELTPAAQPAAGQDAGLRIVVLEGEDSVNVIGQGTAVPTLVEVRDRNDLPVSGANVLFLLGEGGTATLNAGLQQAAVTTNALGQAAVTVNPLTSGTVQLQVSAGFQGQTATAAIVQTNVTSAAAAAGAGAGAAGGGGAGGGGAGTATGAAAGGGAGGGASTAGLLGIVAGGVGAAVAGAALTGSESPVAALNITPSGIGMAGLTEYRFDGSGSSGESLSYSWDFGDGDRGTGTVVTHVYNAAGTYDVTLTVRDGTRTATTTGSATVGRNLDGARFVATDGVMAAATDAARTFFGSIDPVFSNPREELSLTQNGAVLAGHLSLVGLVRGGNLHPTLGRIGSQGFVGEAIRVEGRVELSSQGGCPCSIRLSGNDLSYGISYSLAGTLEDDGNSIVAQVEITSFDSFFDALIGPSTYRRR